MPLLRSLVLPRATYYKHGAPYGAFVMLAPAKLAAYSKNEMLTAFRSCAKSGLWLRQTIGDGMWMRIGISTSVIQRGKTGVAQYLFALLRALLPFAEEHRFILF